MRHNKDKIAANFSSAAARYDHYSALQQQAVLSLVHRLVDLRDAVAPGPILEVGCGTGTLSRQLVDLFPERRLTLMDMAQGMIDMNRSSLAKDLPSPSLIDWQVRDAETLDTRKHYALIASSLTLQWFQDVAHGLAKLCEALTPGGFLLCSYLGSDSFPEWRRACQALRIPCTINPLPDSHKVTEKVRNIHIEATAQEEIIKVTYPTALDFFRSLKRTGTNTSFEKIRLRSSQLARLISALQEQSDGAVTITYQVNTILVRA